MKVSLLYDEGGQILSVVAMNPDLELELLSDRGESVLEVGAAEFGMGGIREIPSQGDEVRVSMAKIRESMRVNVKTRKLVRS